MTDVFYLDLGAGGGRDVCRVVAVCAVERTVRAHQGEACLGRMIESLTVQTNKREFSPIMFHLNYAHLNERGRADEKRTTW